MLWYAMIWYSTIRCDVIRQWVRRQQAYLWFMSPWVQRGHLINSDWRNMWKNLGTGSFCHWLMNQNHQQTCPDTALRHKLTIPMPATGRCKGKPPSSDSSTVAKTELFWLQRLRLRKWRISSRPFLPWELGTYFRIPLKPSWLFH